MPRNRGTSATQIGLSDSPLPSLRCFTASPRTKRFAFSKPQSGQPSAAKTHLETQSSPDPSPAEQKALLERCASDIVFWVNEYCWTYDPREEEPNLRFLLFPKQAEFLLWLKEREFAQEDGLAEKCRDVGFTWLCCAYVVHGWLFRKGFAAGFGSRKLGLVDELGNLDSILEKVRYLIDHLPGWMRPAGYKRGVHDGFCKIVNPQNGASITGEGGDNIGRGGRKTVYIVDEHAFLARPKKVEAALSQTSRCKIRVSTPNGTGNEFYQKRHSGRIPVFTFRWKDDPRKNRYVVYRPDGAEIDSGNGETPDVPEGARVVYPWRDKQEKELDPVTIAQEIDIDYSASVDGICIPAKWVRAAIGLALAGYEPKGSTVGGLDIADGGRSSNVLIARRGPLVQAPYAWPGVNTTQTAHQAADQAERLGVTLLNYDCVGVGAGVRGAYESSERKLAFTASPVNGGAPPSEMQWADGKTSRELFLNLRAELWWIMRRRFEKTYEYVECGIEHPADELISIPDDPRLIADLSLPLAIHTETGKIKLESKADMAKRGVASPDYADALAYTFAPLTSWAHDRETLEYLRNLHNR